VVSIYTYSLETKIASDFYAFLVMELCQKDLAQHFQDRPLRYTQHHSPFVPDELRLMTLQLLQMYKDCHDCGVSHRDVKPENILVTSHSYATGVPMLKLCDFECSKVFQNISSSQPPFHSYLGTVDMKYFRCWMAPEVARCFGNTSSGYDHRSDIWSLGCVIAWITLEGQQALFCTTEERDKPEMRLACLARLEKFPLLQDLVDKMTKHQPENRITLEQALVHPALFSASTVASVFHSVGNEMKNPNTTSQPLADLLQVTPIELTPGSPTNMLRLVIKMRNSLEHVKEKCLHYSSLITSAQNQLIQQLIADNPSIILEFFSLLEAHGKFILDPTDGFQFCFPQ
jgi:serine/threonine protein kinase